jgi:hypothetical protein
VSETTPTDALRSQQGIFIAGLGVLAVAVAGALYFLFQLEMPTVLAVNVGLFIATVAVGQFYLVAKYQLFGKDRQ